MKKGKYKALENIYSFSSFCGEEILYIPETYIKNHIEVMKGEIINYQGGYGRIIRGDEPIDIDFEKMYKALQDDFLFLGGGRR